LANAHDVRALTWSTQHDAAYHARDATSSMSQRPCCMLHTTRATLQRTAASVRQTAHTTYGTQHATYGISLHRRTAGALACEHTITNLRRRKGTLLQGERIEQELARLKSFAHERRLMRAQNEREQMEYEREAQAYDDHQRMEYESEAQAYNDRQQMAYERPNGYA
jgi:hypothetical protein